MPEDPKSEPKVPAVEPTRVERLFPFVRRARIYFAGRDTIQGNKNHLQFVLITKDISENSKADIITNFRHYPVIQCYQSSDLERFFGLHNTKLLGFKKSELSKSIYQELKQFRVNEPLHPNKPEPSPAAPSTPSGPEDPAEGSQLSK